MTQLDLSKRKPVETIKELAKENVPVFYEVSYEEEKNRQNRYVDEFVRKVLAYQPQNFKEKCAIANLVSERREELYESVLRKYEKKISDFIDMDPEPFYKFLDELPQGFWLNEEDQTIRIPFKIADINKILLLDIEVYHNHNISSAIHEGPYLQDNIKHKDILELSRQEQEIIRKFLHDLYLDIREYTDNYRKSFR